MLLSCSTASTRSDISLDENRILLKIASFRHLLIWKKIKKRSIHHYQHINDTFCVLMQSHAWSIEICIIFIWYVYYSCYILSHIDHHKITHAWLCMKEQSKIILYICSMYVHTWFCITEKIKIKMHLSRYA